MMYQCVFSGVFLADGTFLAEIINPVFWKWIVTVESCLTEGPQDQDRNSNTVRHSLIDRK